MKTAEDVNNVRNTEIDCIKIQKKYLMQVTKDKNGWYSLAYFN